MDTYAFDPAPVASPRRPDAKPGAPAGREKLAIVSATNKLCGIAAYTAALRKQLSGAFEVTVLDLDQYLLRGRHPRLRKLGDRHIMELCARIERFDRVNIQLEYGTLGRSARDIIRRLGWLIEAAPALSVTFHTLLPPPVFPLGSVAGALGRFNIAGAMRLVDEYRRNGILSLRVAAALRRAQRRKPLAAIVHNRHDRRQMRHLYGVERVFDHPLAFLSGDETAAVRERASRRDFPVLDGLPDGATLIGVFGFLNDYKGLNTAIRALRHLPDDHHLLIFGGIHPNEITARQPLHPHLANLFEEAFADATPYDRLGAGPVQLTVEAAGGLAELIGPHPRDVSARVHFMGAAADGDFWCGMASCDAVVFPYLEVGQSSSGPISQAVELGCRVIASRTHTFLGFAEYHPGAVEFFDIGNYLELAERLRARRPSSAPDGRRAYDDRTNAALYVEANSPDGAGAPVAAGRLYNRN